MQPTAYSPTTDFSEEEADGVSGRSTLRTAALDTELSNIATTLSQIRTNLSVIQRDDTGLRDLIVEPYTLSAATLALIGSGGFTVSGAWLTATDYPARTIVTNGTGTYVSASAHTSGVFATDLAAGKWVRLFDTAAYVASGITFTPTGSIAATNVQSAIAEVASEAPLKANNLSDVTAATARTNLSVPSIANVQASSSIIGTAGGGVDAITATFTPTITAWTNGQLLIVECAGANATTTPTFNPDAVGAKTIVRPDGSAVVAGDIPGANFRAMFVYDASLDKVLLLNPFRIGQSSSANIAASALGFSMTNGTLVPTNNGSALTVAVKTLAGADPSAADPVTIVFRNATAATGDYTTIALTAATSLVISSGSTMGTSNSTPFRLWIVGFNDAGTFRMGAVNCLSGTSIMPLKDDDLRSSTAEGGAGAADSAQVIYTGTAVASKAMRVLGYMDWDAGLAAAGTWSSNPTKVQLFGHGVPLPGQEVQRQRTATGATASGSVQVPLDDSIPQSGEGDQYMTQAITPTAKTNVLRITSRGIFTSGAATPTLIASLFQDATANALASSMQSLGNGAGQTQMMVDYSMLAGTVSSTTFKYRCGASAAGTNYFNGNSGGRVMGGVANSFLDVAEIMA